MDKAIRLQYTIPDFKPLPERLTFHWGEIKKIKNFREQLQYFNSNIKSLAFVSSAGEIILMRIPNVTEEDNIIYLGPYLKYELHLEKKFNKKHEEIFLEERQKEIDRITAGLEKCADYKSKLNYIFAASADTIHCNRYRIQANLHSKDVKGEWRWAYANAPDVIDLTPRNANEYEIYNLLVKEHFHLSINNPDRYDHDYESFLFEKAKADFERRLAVATKPRHEVIKTEIAEIERIFPHNGKATQDDIFSNKYNGSYLPGDINSKALLNLLMLGGKIDYSKRAFRPMQIEEIIHLEEVNKYYGYLQGLLSGKNETDILHKVETSKQNETNAVATIKNSIHRNQLGPTEWERYNGLAEGQKEIYRENFKNKEDFGGLYSLLHYFTGNDYNNPSRNIVSPFKGGNQFAYKMIAEVRDKIIKELELNNEIIYVEGYWEYIQTFTIAEENHDDFLKLLSAKFEDGKRIWDYKTVKVFAEGEIARFQERYPDDFLSFEISHPGKFFKIPIVNRWVKFLRDVSEGKEKVEERDKKKSEVGTCDNENYSSFDDLFNDEKQLDKCIELLKQTCRPSINDAYEYIGNSKSVFVVWFSAIRSKKGFLKIHVPNDETVTRLLNNKFPGLDLTKDGSLFRKPNKRANDNYKREFEISLSAILSMNNSK